MKAASVRSGTKRRFDSFFIFWGGNWCRGSNDQLLQVVVSTLAERGEMYSRKYDAVNTSSDLTVTFYQMSMTAVCSYVARVSVHVPSPTPEA